MQPLSTRAVLGGLGLIGASLSLASAQGFQPRSGEPVRGLTAADLAAFEAGKIEFATDLNVDDGLGPVFNEISCAGCHSIPAVGGMGIRTVTRYGKKATDTTPFDPLTQFGGTLLKAKVIPPWDHAIYGDYLPPEADVVAQRLTPQSFGMGLIELIPDAQIQANVGSSPNVNGEIRWVTPFEGGSMTPSRFGWKGGVATVLSFSADASVNELGLTNAIFQNDNAPQGDPALLALLDTVADPEDFVGLDGKTRIERQTDFQRFLAPPPQTPKSGMTGETLFNQIGCADCHVKSYTTGDSQRFPALANQVINVYTDFLLHDMGHPDQGGLGDGIVDGIASESKMMTRHLWGVGARGALLHDGRATGFDMRGNLDLAVDWHRGTAEFSRQNYQALTEAERDHVAAFLSSLGRFEFDWDYDFQINVLDWFFLEPLFQGPAGATVTADDAGAVADVDQSGTLDLRDFLIFQRALTN